MAFVVSKSLEFANHPQEPPSFIAFTLKVLLFKSFIHPKFLYLNCEYSEKKLNIKIIICNLYFLSNSFPTLHVNKENLLNDFYSLEVQCVFYSVAKIQLFHKY